MAARKLCIKLAVEIGIDVYFCDHGRPGNAARTRISMVLSSGDLDESVVLVVAEHRPDDVDSSSRQSQYGLLVVLALGALLLVVGARSGAVSSGGLRGEVADSIGSGISATLLEMNPSEVQVEALYGVLGHFVAP